MRFVLIIAGAFGCIAGTALMWVEHYNVPIDIRTMFSVALIIASATSLVIGLATFDIVEAIKAKHVSGYADRGGNLGSGSEQGFRRRP